MSSELSTVILDANLLVRAARGEAQEGRWDKVMSLCEEALSFEAGHRDAWLLLANAQLASKQWENVLGTVEMAARHCHADAGLAVARGEALRQLQRHEEALDAFEEASLLDPDNARYWLERARELTVLGFEDEARECASRAAELNFDDKGFADERPT